MSYLSYDLKSIETEIRDIYSKSASVSKNTGSMAASLKSLQLIIDNGFAEVQSGLAGVYQQLDDLIDVMIDFRNIQFIQNKQRNQFLASIDATLKAPNKTSANEKYEISLELASKNKHETAIKFLKEAIELNPLHYRSYIQLTLNLLKIKNYKEAIYYAKESINFSPDNNEILAYSYSLTAQAYEKSEDYKQALHYINQAINYSYHSSYGYAKARYFALLNDVNQAMTELKITIENDHKYFAISLVDQAFHPFHKEREELLTAMKEEIESKLNQGIAQMEAIKFQQFSNTRLSNCELEYNGFNDSIIDYRYKHLHPNFKGYKAIYITGVERDRVKYCYNSLLDEFHIHYAKLFDFYNEKLPLIKQLKDSNTFVDYYKSYNEFLYFKMEFNQLVNHILKFVQQFKEKSSIAETIFKENLELTREISRTTKQRLQSEQKKKLFNVLGVVGALILPRKLQHDHTAERCLKELYQRVKNVMEEARKNVENEGKHTAAIQRFCDEVLLHNAFPSTLV